MRAVSICTFTRHTATAFTLRHRSSIWSRRAGLAALAITDHDTLGGVTAARQAATGSNLEIVSGVEITSEYRQRELHLLAYFVALDHPGLSAALDDIRRHRVERFREMIERLRGRGVSLEGEEQCVPGAPEALGRRHLAEMLVRARRVANVREAFVRYLGDRGSVAVPKKRLAVAEALALVRDAGGVAASAHPAYDCTQEQLIELRAFGLARSRSNILIFAVRAFWNCAAGRNS